MDLHQELSKDIAAAMAMFDAIPGSSVSVVAEAASRDIEGSAGNFRLLRVVALVIAATLLWEVSDLASVVALWLSQFHIFVARDSVLIFLVVTVFIGLWVSLWRSVFGARVDRLAKLTPDHLALVDGVASLARALPAEMGMLRENLAEMRARMIRTFPSGNVKLGVALAESARTALQSASFAELAAANPPVGVLLVSLQQTLDAILAEKNSKLKSGSSLVKNAL